GRWPASRAPAPASGRRRLGRTSRRPAARRGLREAVRSSPTDGSPTVGRAGGEPGRAGILAGIGSLAAARPPVRTPRPRRPGEGPGGGQPCHVIVLNDNHNTFDHVAATLARYIPGVDYGRGMALANRIHNAGSARVWSGERERAELYWD